MSLIKKIKCTEIGEKRKTKKEKKGGKENGKGKKKTGKKGGKKKEYLVTNLVQLEQVKKPTNELT